jgi:diguanylate cyclase (GGDEF)-like protein/PAS domain S-box-containing protein
VDNDQYRNIIEALDDGVYVVDRNRLITYWNAAAARLTGYGPDVVRGRFCFENILDHVDGEGKNLCRGGCPLAATISDGEPRTAEVYLRHRDGHRVAVKVRAVPLRDPSGRIAGAVEVFSENAAAVAARNRQLELERAALIDSLTDVGNRRFAESALASHLAELERLGRPFGILLVDADHFKSINDEHGHQVGDRVLRTIAATLAGGVRPYDVVARWGGEEFIVICPGLDERGLVGMAERLRLLVEKSRTGLDESGFITPTVSVGAALARPGDEPGSLLGRADAALYKGKRDGRNCVRFAQ